MRKCLLLITVILLHVAARGQTVLRYEYWFDGDRSTLKMGTSATGSWQIEADVSELSVSMHTLHVQVLGTGTVVTGRDDDGTVTLGQQQMPSAPLTRFFVKTPQTAGADYLNCVAIVDGAFYKQERVSPHGSLVDWTFDVASLSPGLHSVQLQVTTPDGVASNTFQKFFMREPMLAEYAGMKCVYAIDGVSFDHEAGKLADGTYHFDLDVSTLADGLHRLSYMLSNGKGVSTQAKTQFFVKTPLGGNGIVEYRYWLNELDKTKMRTVSLAERENPLSLITLLPIESQPIRSSQFEFRVEEGQPAIYAKNDFNICFFDATGRFTLATKPFVDEASKQAVTDIEQLESGVRATAPKPAENTIKWYGVEAGKGDSLRFKLDRAATLQVFSPSGKELLLSAGAESEGWNGLRADENGKYYVAIHDVTAAQGTTLSIDYDMVLDKAELGDVNRDGIVNVVDVTSTISHILGEASTDFRKPAADVNSDGVVNVVDVTSIIEMILNVK